MEYLIHIAIIILIYVMLSQSLALISGYSGLISLAHAGFFGIGAYTSAILSINFNLSFLITLLLAMIINGLLSFIISIIALRTVEEYFIIITLGIQVIVFSIMNNWIGLTNGPMGITNIPSISFFGLMLQSKLSFFILALALTSLVFILLNNIVKSPFGRLNRALSEDEVFSKSLGKNVYRIKVYSFTISAIIATIPGALFANYIGYIDPTSFTINESIFILSIVIIGGIRNLWGCAISTSVLVFLPEVLRFIGLPSNISANVNQIIYGIVLIIMMLKYSRGFISKSYIGQETRFNS